MSGADPAATDPEPTERVGSVAEEAFKLFRALSADAPPAMSGAEGPAHLCTTTWCPLCQVVGLMRDNPDAVARLSESAAAFTRSLLDLLDAATPAREKP